MKNIYFMLLIVSIICMTGDSESFTVFLIWHATWFAVFLISVKKLEGAEE